MKEMPERIYLFDCNDAMTTPLEGDTEYIKKDSFIEKACDWLEQTLEPYIPYCNIDTDLVIEKFKIYMEG